MWVKMCGMRDREDILAADACGADAVGFVFAKSPRQISPEDARKLADGVPAGLVRVGVFVNERRQMVEEIAAYCRLDVLQFHGTETPADCLGYSWPVIKGFRVREGVPPDIERYQVDGLLLDAYVPGRAGGTGMTFDWQVARETVAAGRRVILAGGLHPGNVARAIAEVGPFGLDVSSGIERDGQKDPLLMRRFMDSVKESLAAGAN